MFIQIANDGKELKYTNYWDMDHAKKGFFYLSWNAGSARLLVPQNREDQIKEMKTAKCVIISRGWLQGRDAIEFMFEDHSDNPYCLHLDKAQCDSIPKKIEFDVDIWTQEGKQATFPGKYRTIKELPCMKEWID